jgi:TonB-linked SusC/RagA family outer membrane protein
MKQKFRFYLFAVCFMLLGTGLIVADNNRPAVPVSAPQQSGRITGTITDVAGEPLIGASVVIKGTFVGTATDVDGRYSLNAKQGDILEISFLGYVTQTITVDEKTVYNIVLKDNDTMLGEVVVIGYGTLEKRQVTNSITSISAKELPSGVGGATIGNALSGKVSSLIIHETPSPNTETTLQLRGVASMASEGGPLVVIDGMPGGDLRSVVQEDIQSIDVLKDASAAAIYGTRATGGVILITTKQAQEGKMKLSYTGEVIFKNTFGKPRVMTADEYRKYKGGNYDFGGSYDWYDEALSDNPTSQRHVVSLNGGSRDARIFATAMYEDNRGTIQGDDRIDFSGRLNGAFKVLDGWLDINPHLSYRQANRNLANAGTPLFTNPTKSPTADYPSVDWPYTTSMTAARNPFHDANNITDKGLDKWFRPDVELKLNILPVEGLTYSQTFAYENRQYERNRYEPSFLQRGEWVNRSGLGTALIEFNKTDQMNIDGYFTLSRTFSDIHKINASLGYSFFEKNYEEYSMKNYGFDFDQVGVWNIGNGSYLNNPNISDPLPEMKSYKGVTEKIMAYFGRVNYSLMDKYLASATLRHEGSSKFAPANRWGNFWQLSAAWRLSEENFLQQIAFIDDLKIRAAYGVTGNEGFKATYAAVTYTPSTTRTMLPDGSWVSSYGTDRDINPNLQWEEKHEWNIGIDYELFNRRLFGKFDLFSRNVEKLIYETHNSKGQHGLWYENIGTLENFGWEIEVGGVVVDTKDLKYTSKINFSHNNTKVGVMDGTSNRVYGSYIGRAGYIHALEEGVTVGSFLLYPFAGIQDGNFTGYLRDGSVKVLDGNMDYSEMQFMGNYVPKAVVGWSHDLQYKEWFLQMQINSAIDFDIYNAFEHVNGLIQGTAGGDANKLLSAYTKNADITGPAQATSYFLEDGTYIKIQNVSVGYNLPARKISSLFSSAKIYLTINNALRFSKYSGLNPEIDFTGWAGGVDTEGLSYPQTRTFALGLQLNF